ncbi:hypothetical protein NC99_36340 [Sunxiuqinia dokdonensis]|uniref:Uncharacterized protein n=1 Tax=Sunxiuqinia dokdonensis TaxID=1409788 RepID=A0A0L8V4Y6_9BACT|nr:hypothetical protein NC99_36340 [Sunxiuqinia dokdonensis]
MEINFRKDDAQRISKEVTKKITYHPNKGNNKSNQKESNPYVI